MRYSKIEKDLFLRGLKNIAGVDESGRGPLAGPVFAAAVIFPQNIRIDNLNDSKKLSEKQRNSLFEIINEKAICIGVGVVDSQEIDKINILNATLLAMKKSIENLSVKPDFILVDGDKNIPQISIPQKSIISGDSKCFSIAAASVVAKVLRDRYMYNLHERYPIFGFNKHKGYGTKFHFAAIKKYGICLEHRKTFLKNSVL